MSILETTPQGRKYHCDVCGKEDFWGPTWWRYSSSVLDETCLGDVPHMCSDECRTEGMRRIKIGKWKLPVLKIHGYTPVIKIGKRGY